MRDLLALTTLLAHGGAEHATEAGATAVSVVAVVAMVVPLVVVGFVAWIFLKAKRRDDAAKREEREWQSVRSS